MTNRHSPESWEAKRLEVEAKERALLKLIRDLRVELRFVQDTLTMWRSPSGRAGGPTDLSRCASQPEALIPNADRVVGYRSGQCRNEERAISHTYAMMANGDLLPMCGHGWNRSDGTAFSIFRGAPGTEGECLRCRRNKAAGKPPLSDGWPHKTKWI